jgi:drug/metabolite transporter (DMT)-like permease
MPLRYWIILATIGAAFGSSFAFNEILLGTYGPLTVSAMRVGIGALGCWLWILASGRSAGVPVCLIAALVVFGVFQYAAPFALLPLAQQHITSSAAGIANAMTPVAVVIISHVWSGGERATPAKLFGAVLGVTGIAVLATRGAETGESDPRFVVLAVAAPVCYGIALNLVRRFRGLDPAVVTAWAMTGGAAMIGPVALSLEGIPAVPGVGAGAALASLGFGLTTITFLVLFAVLPKVGATNASLVTLVAPVSATILGAAALGEQVGVGHVAGMSLILAGLVVIDGRVLGLASRLGRPVQPLG